MDQIKLNPIASNPQSSENKGFNTIEIAPSAKEDTMDEEDPDFFNLGNIVLPPPQKDVPPRDVNFFMENSKTTQVSPDNVELLKCRILVIPNFPNTTYRIERLFLVTINNEKKQEIKTNDFFIKSVMEQQVVSESGNTEIRVVPIDVEKTRANFPNNLSVFVGDLYRYFNTKKKVDNIFVHWALSPVWVTFDKVDYSKNDGTLNNKAPLQVISNILYSAFHYIIIELGKYTLEGKVTELISKINGYQENMNDIKKYKTDPEYMRNGYKTFDSDKDFDMDNIYHVFIFLRFVSLSATEREIYNCVNILLLEMAKTMTFDDMLTITNTLLLMYFLLLNDIPSGGEGRNQKSNNISNWSGLAYAIRMILSNIIKTQFGLSFNDIEFQSHFFFGLEPQ